MLRCVIVHQKTLLMKHICSCATNSGEKTQQRVKSLTFYGLGAWSNSRQRSELVGDDVPGHKSGMLSQHLGSCYQTEMDGDVVLLVSKAFDVFVLPHRQEENNEKGNKRNRKLL